MALGVGLCAGRVEAQEHEALRQGGRVGVSLLGGIGQPGGNGDSASVAMTGLALRFGGAFTDRFHLLGELTLAALPGGNVAGLGDVTAFHAALGLAAQGYLGPRLFLRGGVGVGWATATTGNSWYLPLPGPRFAGAVGYDLWRVGARSFSLAVDVSHTGLYNASAAFDGLLTVALHVGFDWY